MNKAPWPDFEGNDLFEGDTLIHPSGQTGKIMFKPDSRRVHNQWFVKYHDQYPAARLCLQVGHKGRAVKRADPDSALETMAERDLAKGHGHWRGHPTLLVNGVWLYKDTGKPAGFRQLPPRPCKQCGKTFEGSNIGEPDPCLGNLPGVDNACCGHGVPEDAYVRFTNGVVLRGFTVETKQP